MGKIVNSLLMLKMLSSGEVYSLETLSNQLSVTKRMIRYYKEELESAGYIIETFKGPNGGYYMNKNNMININFFNKYDLEVLDRIENEMLKLNDKTLVDDFIELNKKLHSIYDVNKIFSEYNDKDIDKSIIDINDKLTIVNNCIKNKKKLFIHYLGSSGKITKREIIPINIFEFENNIYITAFCKLRGNIRHFTFDKILECIEENS